VYGARISDDFHTLGMRQTTKEAKKRRRIKLTFEEVQVPVDQEEKSKEGKRKYLERCITASTQMEVE
jgi:hypothetical protein